MLCSLAMAVVKLDALPDKLNPVIRPIMEAIRCEENEEVRSQAALCLAHLMQNCLSRNPSPNGKIIKNLCGFLCADPTVTPNVMTPMQHRPLGKCLLFGKTPEF